MPSKPSEHRTSIWLFRSLLVLALLTPFIFFPPLRVHRTTEGENGGTAAAFSAHEFAVKFWSEKLQPSLRSAIDVRVLYSCIETESPTAAVKKHARLVGIGGTAYYLVSGDGSVSSVGDDSITLTLGQESKEVLILDTGLVFGNAVRDGTGLLDLGQFANSEEFNAIASELNTIVESSVLPSVKKLGVIGAKLRFIGIAEITDSESDPRPLHLVPLKVEALP